MLMEQNHPVEEQNHPVEVAEQNEPVMVVQIQPQARVLPPGLSNNHQNNKNPQEPGEAEAPEKKMKHLTKILC